MSAQEQIKEILASNKIVLFMKGTPDFPQCGFSNTAVNLIKKCGFKNEDFLSINVLADPEMRAGIKAFADWPTIPQLYVNEEFIGGSDIMLEMDRSGELSDILKPYRG